MGLITRGTEERNEQKMEMILTQHHEAVQNKKMIYRRIGTPLLDKVTLQDGSIVTMQQASARFPAAKEDSCLQEWNVWEVPIR